MSLSNQATLLGTVTSEPRFTQLEELQSTLTFELTTATTWGGDDHVQQRVEVHPIVVRDVFARRLHGMLKIGDQALCVGSVQSEDDDGVRRARVEASIVHELGAPSPASTRAGRNSVVLLGNVGGAPTLKELKDVALLTFRFATNDRDAADWHTIKVWGARATGLHGFLASGHQLAVAGELRHERYVDGQGRAQHVTAVHAHEIQVMARPAGA